MLVYVVVVGLDEIIGVYDDVAKADLVSGALDRAGLIANTKEMELE